MEFEQPSDKPLRVIRTEAELDLLPVDSIVGSGDNVYQLVGIYPDRAAVAADGYDNFFGPFGSGRVWSGIAFDDDPEYFSTAAVWHVLAECYENFDHKGRCHEHEWLYVYYEPA